MNLLYYIILIIYTLALSYITIYCLMQFTLLFHYLKHHKQQESKDTEETPPLEWPFVTIQLPIFNERFVVERLIDNICKMDYPKDRFEIHILDDSTDDTLEVCAQKVEEYKKLGFNIEQIKRVERTGFKAGALQYDMDLAKGEFLAIFDADFLPNSDFLRKTIPHFKNEKVGVVQTRWEHINEDYSLITKLQALQLNVHFSVEQRGRKAGNYLLQFNGTGGIWRRSAIEDAGGWQADTLTEDLDLSIRTQLKGYEIVYLEEVGSPAELPAEMNGLKSQQFRWMKGGAETAKKMLPSIWRSNLKLSQKIHASSHLLGSSIFVVILIAALSSIPLLFILPELKHIPLGVYTYFMLGWLSIISIYYIANVRAFFNTDSYSKKIIKFAVLFPLFLGLSMGLSLHNSIAVIQGFKGKKSPFIRTPKFNLKTVKDKINSNTYLAKQIPTSTIIEGLLALLFACSLAYGLYTGQRTFLVFHFLLTIGFGSICFYSIKHLQLRK
ncbi:MAG: glycosyltransferase family 2 protein [Saprospiraceae bacterium]|nr:glycosyltransferase family 2 protein [Saprospiraceae bacterium]